MGYLDYAGLQYLWGKLKEKFAPKSHSHDDRYYTESEVDGKLSEKENSQVLTTVTDVNSLKTTGIYHCKNVMTNNATSNHGTLYVDFSVGTPYQIWMPDNQNTAYKRIFSGNAWTDWTQLKFTDTNTWRGIQNNLTSDSTSDSLSAAQGKALKGLVDGKAPNGHTHQYLSLYGARPANINFTKSTNGTGAMFHFVATSSTTTGKPPADSSILQLNWDNNGGWDSQLALSTTASPHVYYRNQQNGTWGNWSTLLDNLNYADYAAKKEHTHTKSQITDFPASLKNPTALTIQTNGATAAIYDGSAAKTVNITKDNIGLGNVDNTADANKSVKYATSAGSANTSSSCTGNSASATKLTSSAGSATQPVYFKDGKPVAGTYTLGDASSKTVRTLGAVGNTGWANKTTDDKYIPTMSFMAYWNGAYSGTSSNLQYCDRGRFGTIVTKNSGDYAAANHTHDDRYYTESEVNTKLANYQPKGNYAAASHTHNYAGSGSAGGSANSAIKLDSSAGSATQPVYFKDGKPVATTYALNKTVPADAKFTDTNTWRGIQNNLTSDSTDQSLSAAQGKALKTLVDGKAPASHKHTKSQITDFPTSMPASDVSAWAKAATKPSYTKAEVGLSNVDNTADKDKSVKYAASAGSASQLNGFTIQASTSDLTAGSSKLSNNVIYIVYE